MQLQNKDQELANLTSENENLSSALNAIESRVAELYTEQGRMEEELAGRLDIVDKLRSQMRELEKDKRDLQKRYNEQVGTFNPRMFFAGLTFR